MTDVAKAVAGDGGITLPPGEFLKRRMALAGLSATALAQEIKVHVQTIYNVTTGKRPISSTLALKLSRRFVEPVEVWLSDAIEISADSAQVALTAKRARRSGQVEGLGSTPLFAGYSENVDGILVDREIEDLLASRTSPVSIAPFDPAHVQPASYDLTIGIIIEAGFRELSEHQWGLVLRKEHDRDAPLTRETEYIEELIAAKEGKIRYSTSATLRRGDSVVILAREFVSFSTQYLAEVGSTATNAMSGLLVNHGFQIDPGYAGPIFVTAMNIGLDDFPIAAGDKIVSIALRRLARPPERAYQADIGQRILGISEKVDKALKGLFRCRALLGEGEVIAESTAFDEAHIGTSEDEALNKAVASIMAALAQPGAEDPEKQAIAAAVGKVLSSISIDKPDAKALVRYFAVADDAVKARVMKFFVAPDDRQTLGATLERLNLDPILALVRISEEDPVERRRFEKR